MSEINLKRTQSFSNSSIRFKSCINFKLKKSRFFFISIPFRSILRLTLKSKSNKKKVEKNYYTPGFQKRFQLLIIRQTNHLREGIYSNWKAFLEFSSKYFHLIYSFFWLLRNENSILCQKIS